jgi:predicted nucleotidyltransferase
MQMNVMSQDSLESYRQGLAERSLVEETELEARFQHAWVLAKKAAERLHSDYKVAAVYLFGSLLHRDLFHPHSDIDLAIKGLPAHDYYRAVGTLLALSDTLSFDLVLFEEAPYSLQVCIDQEGICL